jgi:hypothetical protein
MIIDTAMMSVSETRIPDGRLPDYRIHIRTPFYSAEGRRFGTLLKLHGSLNWLHCRTCQRTEIGASDSRRYLKGARAARRPITRAVLHSRRQSMPLAAELACVRC